jgi:hypothetical protein
MIDLSLPFVESAWSAMCARYSPAAVRIGGSLLVQTAVYALTIAPSMVYPLLKCMEHRRIQPKVSRIEQRVVRALAQSRCASG